jgi:hypothetical protein
MQLLVAHQILIGAAIGLASIFGLRGLVLFSRTGESMNLGLGIASLAVAAALGLYFRTVRAKWRASQKP